MSYGLTLPHPYEKTVFIYFPPFFYHNNFFKYILSICYFSFYLNTEKIIPHAEMHFIF